MSKIGIKNIIKVIRWVSSNYKLAYYIIENEALKYDIKTSLRQHMRKEEAKRTQWNQREMIVDDMKDIIVEEEDINKAFSIPNNS